MRIALAQLNPVVGDFEGNAKQILDAVRSAEEQAAEPTAVEHQMQGHLEIQNQIRQSFEAPQIGRQPRRFTSTTPLSSLAPGSNGGSMRVNFGGSK